MTYHTPSSIADIVGEWQQSWATERNWFNRQRGYWGVKFLSPLFPWVSCTIILVVWLKSTFPSFGLSVYIFIQKKGQLTKGSLSLFLSTHTCKHVYCTYTNTFNYVMLNYKGPKLMQISSNLYPYAQGLTS